MINKKFIVTGGGSGGHVSAASAVIYTLIDDYGVTPQDITYIGGDLGMVGEKRGNSLEQKRFKDVAFRTRFIRAGKLQRRVAFSTLKLLLRTVLGFKDSFTYVRESKADAVISVGGFVSVPVCIWAKILGKPIFLHEQTASVGLSNRIVSRFSKTVYTAFKDSERYFKGRNVVHVGNTVRKAVLNSNAANVSKELLDFLNQHQDLPLIYISGGGLGSHLINEKVISELPSLLEKYKIILQTGDNQIHNDHSKALERKKELTPEYTSRFLPLSFIEDNDIGYVYHNMSLFIGRSGANTVYEIGILQKPAIFIPIPWVTHNEQYLNAKVLEDLGIAKILSEKDLPNSNLYSEIERFFEQVGMRNIDREKLEKLFPVNATSRMIEDICTKIE